MKDWLNKVFGDDSSRFLKDVRPVVAAINALEPEMVKLADADFPIKTQEFKKRIADGATLDEIIPEAFALAREAGKRTLQMRHFDVQLIGGLALCQGKIAEMKTGEGKTLVATLPLIFNTLTGKGAHLVTVNEYLAARDADWMRPVYEFFGLTVGVILSGQSSEESALRMQRILRTVQTMNLDLITCVTIWQEQ